jgi:hypothetical protein
VNVFNYEVDVCTFYKCNSCFHYWLHNYMVVSSLGPFSLVNTSAKALLVSLIPLALIHLHFGTGNEAAKAANSHRMMHIHQISAHWVLCALKFHTHNYYFLLDRCKLNTSLGKPTTAHAQPQKVT